ncbi:MAG: GTP-binding protein [Clostridiales bacterium]|nr:GTP-binding protein [Clostridiales bacterium]
MLAHVDAGKTTLSEALLFCGGALQYLGRVDHQDAFLDTDSLERKRGITIFSKQALLSYKGLDITLMDTPGHIDFSSEMEKVLSVLDYAILIINGSDGIQGHSLTLWQLLQRYEIPTFIFINKMDLPQTDAEKIMSVLRERFGEGCVHFGKRPDQRHYFEEIAVCSEEVLTHFLKRGTIGDEEISNLIAKRLLFPCYFGSALKLSGVDELLDGISKFSQLPQYPDDFGARVFKIGRDAQGMRLSYLKVTGGVLKTRDIVRDGHDKEGLISKVTQIRFYSADKYAVTEEAAAGSICAVTGLSDSYPGQALGAETELLVPALQPVLSYRMIVSEENDAFDVFKQLKDIREEDPQLALSWDKKSREIHLLAMGEVQLEVLSHIIKERFGLVVSFDAGRILYKETIAYPVIGMGHFEPLKHYAEVHFRLEPLPRGSGLHYDSSCSEDILPRNDQNFILNQLTQQVHAGVLTGSPLTDLRITLLTGRAHPKHTVGGDFREAAFRALRQGLMQAKNILLEPWYRFSLELPAPSLGRAMTDFSRVSEDILIQSNDGQYARLQGSAPVAFMRDYLKEITAYTHGLGRLSCAFMGFAACSNPQEVIADLGYNPEQDISNPADSVFCKQGASVLVKWHQAQNFMHVDTSAYFKDTKKKAGRPASEKNKKSASQSLDDELKVIFERTYGPVKRRGFEPVKKKIQQNFDRSENVIKAPIYEKPDYLLVDGYNIIHAWEELRQLSSDNMDAARQLLMDRLSNYRGMIDREIILVFDAYRVPSGVENVTLYHNIHIVYTKEAETADAYIEKVSYEIGKKHRVSVATADGVIQLIALCHGALRISPDMLKEEIAASEAQMQAILDKNYQKASSRIVFPEEKSIES